MPAIDTRLARRLPQEMGLLPLAADSGNATGAGSLVSRRTGTVLLIAFPVGCLLLVVLLAVL